MYSAKRLPLFRRVNILPLIACLDLDREFAMIWLDLPTLNNSQIFASSAAV